MRSTALSTIAIAFALEACGSDPNAGNAGSNTAVTRLTVKALEVRSGPGVPPGGPRNLSGRFEIREARQGETYVEGPATGGACLIAQVPIDPKTCTADAQCGIPGKPFLGYCLRNQCWVKPANDSCLRGQPPQANAYETPQKDTNEIYTYLASIGESRPVSWMVLGRLNGLPVQPEHSCTTSQTYMYDCGNPRKVP